MANKKVSQLVSKPSVLVTDLFPIADPTTGQLYKTTISDLGTAIGSGVSSVNTLVGAVVLDTDDIQELASPTNRWFTDTRARAAVSASSPLAYNSGTGVFSIPAATSSQNGYLTSTDWTTFNNKLSPATASSTYLPLVLSTTAKSVDINGQQFTISGSTGGVFTSGRLIVDPDFSGIGYQTAGVFAGLTFTTAGAAIFSNSGIIRTLAANSLEVGYSSQQGAGFKLDINGTARFTGDVTLSSANPRLYFTDSDNNPDYFISNTDGTFTVYDVTNSVSRFTIGTTGNGTFGGNLTVGQIIRSGGTSSQFLKADGSVDSSTYLTTGTASSTYLPLGGGTLTGALFATSASFSGFVGFGGNTSPLAAIDVTGAGRFSSTISAAGATLTGALSGTSASFSGRVNASTLYVNSTEYTFANFASAVIGVRPNNDGISALWLRPSDASNNVGTAMQSTSSTFTIGSLVAGPYLSLALSTGAATFSSSVTANGLTVNGGSGNGILVNGNNGSVPLPTTGLSFMTGFGVAYLTNYNTSGAFADLYYSASNHLFNNKVGIGTTAPGTPLDVVANSSANAITIRARSSNDYGLLDFKSNNGSEIISEIYIHRTGTNVGNLIFTTNNGSGSPSERMRITSGGRLLVGQTSVSSASVNGACIFGDTIMTGSFAGIFWENRSGGVTTNSNWYGWYTTSGTIYLFNGASNVASISPSTGIYMALSDKNKKKDFEASNIGLNEIMKLKPTLYRMKSDSEEDSKQLGFIAQEVKDVLPQAYVQTKTEKEDFIGLNFNPIVAALTKAVQELKAELDTLKNK